MYIKSGQHGHHGEESKVLKYLEASEDLEQQNRTFLGVPGGWKILKLVTDGSIMGWSRRSQTIFELSVAMPSNRLFR